MDPDSADSEPALREAIDRYNAAWNTHDLDAIMAMHAPDIKRKDVYSDSVSTLRQVGLN
jgi:ketosteroid isomerase-like protein